jgi:hypothetical protein
MALRTMNLDAFKATPLTREPFEFLTVPNFLNPEACAAINRDYPKIGESGSFPVAQLCFGRPFRSCSTKWRATNFATPSPRNSMSI